MSEVISNQAGGYRFVKGVFQYSAGVAAEPGWRIERARFKKPLPLAEAFQRVAAHLESIGRPRAAFCSCELRSPAPFSEAGFLDFNRSYVEPLQAWKIFLGELNPVARTNVCPEIHPPKVPSMFAFSYTVPADGQFAGFIAAGSGETPEGKDSYLEHTVRLGDTSPQGLQEKAKWVCGEMEGRMKALGYGWAESTATQLYTVHDVHPFLAQELVRRGAMHAGLTWHFTRPPVAQLDYEMDVRGVSSELVI